MCVDSPKKVDLFDKIMKFHPAVNLRKKNHLKKPNNYENL